MVTKKHSTTGAIISDKESLCAILQYFFPIGQIWYLVDENIAKANLQEACQNIKLINKEVHTVSTRKRPNKLRMAIMYYNRQWLSKN